MNRPEPIELENNLGPDAVTGEINRVPWMAYDVDEMDIYIAELESRIPVWYKFSEKTPEHHQSILCYCPRAKFCKVALRRWDEGTKFDVFEQELYTHWMRLPEEPKEAQDEVR